MESYRKGALYIRVSTNRQDELSPDAQKRLLAEYARKNHITLAEDFTFYESVSGRRADKRPEFQKLIALAKHPSHPIDVILVWKFSRFARNQEESIVYKSMLRKQHHVDVVSVSEPLIEGPFGSLIERIIEWMDEYYSVNLSGEVLRGMTEKALQHGYQTTPCLGYRAAGQGKPFLIDEGSYPIVAYIMDQYDICGSDPAAIARSCNARGYRTRRGNPFTGRTVEYILRNPFYAGRVLWNGIEFEGSHEVRLSRARYEKRIRLMESRQGKKRSRHVSGCRHWLSGLLRCPICSATLSYSGACAYPYFQCWRYAKGIHPISVSISVPKIEQAVFCFFQIILADLPLTYVSRRPVSGENTGDPALSGEEYRTEGSPAASACEEHALSRVRTPLELLQDPQISFEIKGSFLRLLLERILLDKDRRILYFDIKE